jgi:hypothetical protein
MSTFKLADDWGTTTQECARMGQLDEVSKPDMIQTWIGRIK